MKAGVDQEKIPRLIKYKCLILFFSFSQKLDRTSKTQGKWLNSESVLTYEWNNSEVSIQARKQIGKMQVQAKLAWYECRSNLHNARTN